MKHPKLALVLVVAFCVGVCQPSSAATPRECAQALWKHGRVPFLVFNLGLGFGFYKGIHWNEPEVRPVQITEYEVPQDDPSFAVRVERTAYAIDEGVVYDETGSPLPGSEQTQAIGAFRGRLVRVSKQGMLSFYSEVNEAWTSVDVPAVAQMVASDKHILVLTVTKELLVATAPDTSRLTVGRDAVAFGSERLTFRRVEGDFSSLSSHTRPGFFQPEVLVARGVKQSAIFLSSGEQQRIDGNFSGPNW